MERFSCGRKLYEAHPLPAESGLILAEQVMLTLFYLKLQMGRLLNPATPDPLVHLNERDLRHLHNSSYRHNSGFKSSPLPLTVIRALNKLFDFCSAVSSGVNCGQLHWPRVVVRIASDSACAALLAQCLAHGKYSGTEQTS